MYASGVNMRFCAISHGISFKNIANCFFIFVMQFTLQKHRKYGILIKNYEVEVYNET